MYQRLRDLREDRDLSQEDMAKMLNIHQTTYSDYELGNINIPVDILIQLANFFETTIDDIVERDKWK